MATLFPLGLQFFDAIGQPLALGTMSFYEQNSLTPKTIYDAEDEGGTLTNPLVLDSEGRVPEAGIWGSGTYRVRIQDADGVIIYDIDDLVMAAEGPTGSGANYVYTTTVDQDSTVGVIPLDNSIPQSSEGEELTLLNTTITPTSSTSKLRITVDLNLTSTGATQPNIVIAVFRDSATDATYATAYQPIVASTQAHTFFMFETPSTAIAATTFKIRYGVADDTGSPTIYLNSRGSTAGLFSTAGISSMLVEEII